MGLFGRSKPDSETIERLERMESQLNLLRVEWQDVLEKVLNALARLKKRDRDQAGADTPPTTNAPASGPALKAALWQRAQQILNGRAPSVRS